MDDLFGKVFQTNRQRVMDIFDRRMLKLGEEYGEACQAYLSVSSENNSKKKSWDDVREELVDVLVVTLDLLCHTMPDEKDMTEEEKLASVTKILNRKLDKWAKKIKKSEDTSK
jgi:NTP pyrophosphatase (non-canonical NTP hydrolase)